ncbi:plasmid partitioning protein RepB C-terminal domain-containing protein, partial [Acinetobacter calcoaceticus]|uniref:plasmid partitioning protein RepB C-terminal domain-containing protein n=1 Tax=Acinetobacter calcoaceticus TaxID=471 RepID=UPI003F7C520A
RLEAMGFGREAIQAALTVDYQTLSKMLTIPKAIPEEILLAIGPAKGIGRDRWLELRKLVEKPGKKAAAAELIETDS